MSKFFNLVKIFSIIVLFTLNFSTVFGDETKAIIDQLKVSCLNSTGVVSKAN